MDNLHEHRSCTEQSYDVHCDHHSDGDDEVAYANSASSEESEHEHQPCDEESCVFTVGSRTTFVVADQWLLYVDIPFSIASPQIGLTTATTYEAMRGLGSLHWVCAHNPQWTQAWLL